MPRPQTSSTTVLHSLQTAGSSGVRDPGFKQLVTLETRVAMDPSDPADVPDRGRILTHERHIISDLPPSLSTVNKLDQAVAKGIFSARYSPAQSSSH